MNRRKGRIIPFRTQGMIHLEAMSLSLDSEEIQENYGVMYAGDRVMGAELLEEELMKIEKWGLKFPSYTRTLIRQQGEDAIGIISKVVFKNEQGKLRFLMKYFPEEVIRMPELVN